MKILHNMEQLPKLFLNNKCILYCAGKVARTVAKYAAINKYVIEDIFVSNMQDNPPDILGIPVHVVSDYDGSIKDKSILVCAMENLHEELQ